MDREESLKARRQDLLDNLDAAERSHSEEWQLQILDELQEVNEELDKLYDEALEGEDESA